MEFRKVSLTNLSRLSEMFKLCLNREVDESYFLWKYKNNPSGEVVAFEAVEGDTIAAFYGVIPERYCISGQDYIIYQSMDTMTHPNFQKKGLFVKLAQMTYDYLKEQNGNVHIVGIPGGNSFHGFVNKLNWKNIHNFKYLFLPRIVSSFVAWMNRDKNLQFIYADRYDEDIRNYLTSFDWPSVQKIRPKIDSEIFDWKVWQHPFKNFKVVKVLVGNTIMGYCICSTDEQGYLKIEQLELGSYATKQSIAGLCQFLFRTNPKAKFLYTWEPTNLSLAKAYKAASFLKNPYQKGLFSYAIPFITYSSTSGLQGKNWFLIQDFDVQPFLQD